MWGRILKGRRIIVVSTLRFCLYFAAGCKEGEDGSFFRCRPGHVPHYLPMSFRGEHVSDSQTLEKGCERWVEARRFDMGGYGGGIGGIFDCGEGGWGNRMPAWIAR